MNWSDISTVVGKAAPVLGTLIGGPAGAAVGALVASTLGTENTPDAVSQALAVSPDAAVKLKEIEAQHATELKALVVQSEANRIAADTATIAAVNATMQVEARSDHWPTFSWRPFIGFVFGTTFFGTYFVLPLLKLPVPTIPFEAWACIGAVLGTASYFRGKAQADPNIPTDNRG